MGQTQLLTREEVKATEPQSGASEDVKATEPQSGASEDVKATEPQSGDSGNKNENENAVNDAAAAGEDPAQATAGELYCICRRRQVQDTAGSD